jgi:cold shock CspA family protein
MFWSNRRGELVATFSIEFPCRRQRKMRGTVVRLIRVQGYGFIKPTEPGDDVFFNAGDLQDLAFDHSLKERVVIFDTETTDKGLRARGVRAEH